MTQPGSYPRVGVIGLGQIGGAMAQRLVESGIQPVVFDIDADAVRALGESGAQPVEGIQAVARWADIVSVIVRDDAQVREVSSQILDAEQHPSVVAIHSTIAAATAQDLASISAPRGVDVVDAPVSGGAAGATTGKLAMMVGGGQTAFELCQKAFDAVAELIVHAGPVGAGTHCKLARNLLHFASFSAAAESQRLAEAAGIDLQAFGEIVRHSDAITGGPGAIMRRSSTAALQPSEPAYARMSNVKALGEKDLQLAIDMAERFDVDVPFAYLALKRLGTGLGVPEIEENV